MTKNKEDRVVVLSEIAQRIMDELRGQYRKGRRRRAAACYDILAHKTGRITTRYSVPEIGTCSRQ